MFSTGIVLLCFDKTYREATPISQNDEWIEIKMPIALPYSNDFVNPAAHQGLIEYQGKYYNIVEQHYSNDTLVTRIKTNHSAKQKLQSIADELGSQFAEQNSGKDSPLKKALDFCKSLSGNYIPTTDLSVSAYPWIYLSTLKNQFYYHQPATQLFIMSIFTPPEVS
jgi:hypothetical protein